MSATRIVVRNIRTFSTSRVVRASSNPHGGEGTAYKERERAAEAAYIRKHEEDLAKAHAKSPVSKV